MKTILKDLEEMKISLYTSHHNNYKDYFNKRYKEFLLLTLKTCALMSNWCYGVSINSYIPDEEKEFREVTKKRLNSFLDYIEWIEEESGLLNYQVNFRKDNIITWLLDDSSIHHIKFFDFKRWMENAIKEIKENIKW